jgi:hypothetical protein
VSFQSREKKRRYKAAEASARRNRTSETASRWFLTLAKKPGRYMCCGGSFDRGAEIVFRHEPRAIRCVRCAERLEDSKDYRLSFRWERAQRGQAPQLPTRLPAPMASKRGVGRLRSGIGDGPGTANRVVSGPDAPGG